MPPVTQPRPVKPTRPAPPPPPASFKDLAPTSLIALAKTMRSWVYAGNQRFCPCCRGHFRKFMPFGVVLRDDARCPRCGSLERHRLMWLYLKRRTNLFTAPLRVLHFAPEPVFQNALKKLKNLDYLSADLYDPRVMEKIDITDIPYPEASFDVILCNHVLEHIVDDAKAMSQLYRVLAPGGWAILQTPFEPNRDETYEDPTITSPSERLLHFGQHDHVRIYGRDYGDRLQNAGFSVHPDPFVKTLTPKMVQHMALPPDEEIYLCLKPGDGHGPSSGLWAVKGGGV